VADVGGLELGEFLGVLVDQRGQTQQDALALARVGQRPDAVIKRPPRRSHRPVDILSRPPRDRRDHASIARRDIRERPSVGRRNEPPADERLGSQTSTACPVTA
jgi:hypothetical protein